MQLGTGPIQRAVSVSERAQRQVSSLAWVPLALTGRPASSAATYLVIASLTVAMVALPQTRPPQRPAPLVIMAHRLCSASCSSERFNYRGSHSQSTSWCRCTP